MQQDRIFRVSHNVKHEYVLYIFAKSHKEIFQKSASFEFFSLVVTLFLLYLLQLWFH